MKQRKLKTIVPYNNFKPTWPIILLVYFVSISLVNGQTDRENTAKYYAYKTVLYNKFMFTHDPLQYPPHGSWIPAHKRNPHAGYSTSNEIHWADAGHTIGYLLATLATEYKLQLLNGATKNAEICAEDIANIFRSLERLDYLATFRYQQKAYPIWKLRDTIIYPYPYPQNALNGFFLRDDIGHPHFPEAQINKQPEFNKTNKRFSDYGRNDEMSQDQVWNLLQGLALTAKLVESETTYIDGEGDKITLKKWAQKLTCRFIKAMQPQTSIEIFGIKIPIKLWSIYNPVTKKRVKRGGKPSDLMLNARLFSTAAAKICNIDPAQTKFGFEPNIELSLPLKGHKHFNDHAKLALAVIGKTQYASSFDSILYWCYRCAKSYNQKLPTDYQTFAYPHFPLMFLTLHNTHIDTHNYFYHLYMSYIELRLNQAPAEGPWRSLFDINNDEIIDKNDHPEPFWSAGKRLVKPTGKDYVINPNDPATMPWEYNGLDYMLLYNLFELTKLTHFQTAVPKKMHENYIYKGWKSSKGKPWKKTDANFVTVHPTDNIIPLKLYGKENQTIELQNTTNYNKPSSKNAVSFKYNKSLNSFTIQLQHARYARVEIIDIEGKSIWSTVIKRPTVSIPLDNIATGTPHLLILHATETQYMTIYIKSHSK